MNNHETLRLFSPLEMDKAVASILEGCCQDEMVSFGVVLETVPLTGHGGSCLQSQHVGS